MHRKHPESVRILAEFKAQAVLNKLKEMECSEDFVGSSPFKLTGDAPSSAPEALPEDGAVAGGSQQDAKEAEAEEEEDEFEEPDDDDDDQEDDADRGRGKRVRKETKRLDPAPKSKISKKPKAAKGKSAGRGQQPGPRGLINPSTGEREKMNYKKGGRPPKNTVDKQNKAGVHTHTLPK